ncbi:Fic family protein [Rhodoplanes roseus]|uniref:Filamentation protein n=1 Tax=Rhodoplanes roseus TaxID=29409 RepID=A0A327L4A7_9BRAD|nr:Fic family protein [Rhodoplanes roseus]RAI44663.1 filamentation protein [Rhodoplanes roseus]
MTVAAMEPLLPETGQDLEDLAIELVAKSNALAGRLNPALSAALGDLVRSMNCYYSNLIEGHNTLPIDIDRALAGDFANDETKRNLQLEARAHIEVQQMIDRGDGPGPIVSREFILWLHRSFGERLPDELLRVEDSDTKEKLEIVPGELRTRHVVVGRHIPPAPDELPAFLARFTEAYASKHLSTLRKIIGVAAAHHRLLWIHPFLDGNGRVTRLFSHAWLRELGVGSALWSVSRGLARNVETYKALLMAADEPRRGDLDGRGNITQAGLDEFCRFFLSTCVDQVTFMEGLLEPAEMLRRMEIWAEEEVRAKRLLKGSWPLLREAVIAGEFARGRAAALTGYETRQARTVLNTLIKAGYLVAPTPRSTVRLGFPVSVLERWLPRLYIPATV